MNNESKNKWSVIINIALTTLTAILTALGFNVGYAKIPSFSIKSQQFHPVPLRLFFDNRNNR